MPLDSIAVFSVLDRVTNSDGTPVASGTVEFYLAGTSTPLTVYSDYGLSTSLGTTVSLNSAGYPVSGGGSVVSVYTGTSAYKIIVKDADGATIADLSRDNIKGAVEIPVTDELALPETPVVTKTAAYSIVDADQGKVINASCTGGSFVLTLPSAVTVGDGWRVAVRHVGTANVATIRSTASQTIDIPGKQVTSFALKGRGQSVWLVSDGANWHEDGSTPALMQDGLPFIKITDRLTAPPTSPTGGARYIANGTPTGAWSTLGFSENQIIEADGNGSWFAYTPADGWLAYVEDENLLTQYRDSAWTDFTNITAPTSSTLECAQFEHQQTNGTVGGTATTGAWTKRTLNTSVSNTITGCSIASSQITLPVGTYFVDFQQSLHQTSQSQSRIKVMSGTATPDPILGGAFTGYAADSAGHTPGTIEGQYAGHGILTVTAVAVIELQYWVAGSAGGTSALGAVSAEPGSSVEMYARVRVLSLAAIQGPPGTQGTQGNDGLDAAYDFQWNTATSGDPGSGKLLLNNATFASVTQINISETTNSGASIADVLATWDDSTSSVRGQIKFSKEGTPGTYRALNITGAGTDAGTYWTFPVAPVDDNGSLASNDDLAVIHTRTGDKGDAGTTGAQGDPGTPGTTGATGPNTGLDFAWSTATSGDPGSGKVLANNATLASATAINISKTGRNSESLGAVIATWDDSTNTSHYGHLRIFTVADRTEYIEAEVTGLTDNSTYYTVAVTVTAAAGTPSANDVMAVMFERTGTNGTSFTWRGEWVTSTVYALRDAVSRDGSSYICTSAHTSGAGTEPGTGGSWATVWDLMAAKGTDGLGVGDVVGPASATNNALAQFDGTTGKLLEDSGVTVSTDGTLAGNSDTLIPTQKAVKAYADALIAANDAMVFEGVVDCSANPNYPAADRGHTYRVSVAGKIGGGSGPNVQAGDILLCLTDSTSSGDHATVGAQWSIIQVNIDGALLTTDIGTSVQAYDALLAAVAALGSNGLMARTAAGTAAARSVAAGSGIGVTNGDGVSGNPTVAMDVAGLTAETAPAAGDYVPFYDDSATANRKLAMSKVREEVIVVTVSDETTAITTGTAKVTFRMPFAMTLTAVRASLSTASSSGTPTVDINEGGSTILSTKLTIDASELTSTTAATAAVISDTSLADDAEITIDIDTAGTGAKGLKVALIGYRT